MTGSRPLRLLTLTNTFPPTARGGYGEICGDVSLALARRGHSLTVLSERASPERLGGGALDQESSATLTVRRELELVLGAWRRPVRALPAMARAETSVRRALAEGIDAALVWHMRGVPKPCLRVLHDAGVPVIYMLHDRWVLYDRAGALTVPVYRLDRIGLTGLRNLLATPLARWRELRAPPIRRSGIVCFVSEWLEREYARLGWSPARAHVITAGVDLGRFCPAEARPTQRPAMRLLYAGRIHPTKGLDTAVEALAAGPGELRLTVAGHVDDISFAQRIRARATELGVESRIEWRGEVPREFMPELLSEHDVLVYPSVAVESGWLGVLEGLAAELIVATSAPGAPRELVRDGENALLFRPGDATELAEALQRLAADADLRERLRAGAREAARAHTLDGTVTAIEALAERCAARAGARSVSPATGSELS